jgi:hypothetical protein
MIKNLCTCPFCELPVAYDFGVYPEDFHPLRFDPDGKGEPCPHLVFVGGFAETGVGWQHAAFPHAFPDGHQWCEGEFQRLRRAQPVGLGDWRCLDFDIDPDEARGIAVFAEQPDEFVANLAELIGRGVGD